MADAEDFTTNADEAAEDAQASQDGKAEAQASTEASPKKAPASDDAAAGAKEDAPATAEDEVAKAKAEAADWQDKFMRLHAEWDTYRRRMNEQREEEKKHATEGLVSKLLPVLDDFERSIDYAEKNGEGDLLDGVQKVHTKLLDVLVKSGVEVIDPAGQAFDSLEAQAVATIERTDVPDETVQDVYQKGYRMGKKVIRPAMVTVTSGGPKREKDESEDSDK